MRVLVTGAAGYLGRNLVTALAERGDTVTAADLVTELPADTDHVSWRRLDVLDADAVAAMICGYDLVFHLAARITLHRRDEAAWRLNTEGVRIVSRAALSAGVPRFVHCSSVHSFDTSAPGVLSEQSPRSVADSTLPLYDRSKFAGEIELQRVIDDGLSAVIANPTGVFGPPDAGPRMSRMNGMLRDAALGRIPVDIRGGFDWVDVRDVTTGLLQAAAHGRVGENYLLGGHKLSIHDAFRMAANVTGRRGSSFSLPHWTVKGLVPLATAIGRRVDSDVLTVASLSALRWNPSVDSSRARTELGYRARPSEETIRDLVTHFVATGRLDRHQ
ncbi:MAG: NAD-dependent epimerase/dehydratase family protein [Propionibacteriaceae bacterium]|nr:NAD-dependent epimerase/dehydratase family protein [Propionibacteriaceae bacterium]